MFLREILFKAHGCSIFEYAFLILLLPIKKARKGSQTAKCIEESKKKAFFYRKEV